MAFFYILSDDFLNKDLKYLESIVIFNPTNLARIWLYQGVSLIFALLAVIFKAQELRLFKIIFDVHR